MKTQIWLPGFILCTALILLSHSGSVAARRGSSGRSSCGVGCVESMGACTVNPNLWSALLRAREAGIQPSSCCRTAHYNQQLRSCGYPVAPNSAHMSGLAVDLLISPQRCNSASLSAYGFSGVCPYYHFGHCHISVCGTAGSYQDARAQARKRAREIRMAHARDSNSDDFDFDNGWVSSFS